MQLRQRRGNHHPHLCGRHVGGLARTRNQGQTASDLAESMQQMTANWRRRPLIMEELMSSITYADSAESPNSEATGPRGSLQSRMRGRTQDDRENGRKLRRRIGRTDGEPVLA